MNRCALWATENRTFLLALYRFPWTTALTIDSRTAIPIFIRSSSSKPGTLGHAERQFFGAVHAFQSRIQKPFDGFRNVVLIFPHTQSGQKRGQVES